MGLSNEERLHHMYYSINSLFKKCNDLNRELGRFDEGVENNYYRLAQEGMTIWDSFLGQISNGGHWLFGSSATSPIESNTNSPWSIAIWNHLRGTVLHNDSVEDPFKRPSFDATEYLSLPAIISNNEGKRESIAYEIFALIECVIYPLRRYNDEFSKGYSELGSKLSLMMGICFDIFNNDEGYAKSYLAHQVVSRLYRNYNPYNDIQEDDFTKYIVKNHIHHDLVRTNPKITIKELAAIQLVLNDEAEQIDYFLSVLSIMKFNDIQSKRLYEYIKVNYPDYCDEASFIYYYNLYMYQKKREREQKDYHRTYEQRCTDQFAWYIDKDEIDDLIIGVIDPTGE